MTLGVGFLTEVGEEPQGKQPCNRGGENGEWQAEGRAVGWLGIMTQTSGRRLWGGRNAKQNHTQK